MQNRNSFFIIRLTIDEPCLFYLFILVLAISPLMAIAEARAALITFDEYPVGTTITNQYQNLGVVFSGEPQAPSISIPPSQFFGNQGPALLGFALPVPQWGSGSTIATFVDPIDGTPVEAVNARFSYYVLFGEAVTFTFYDINGGIISQQEANTGNMYTFSLYYPPKIHKFVITPGRAYTWIENLTFQPQPKITLRRLNLMTIEATRTPADGIFAYNVALTAGANPPAISFANGYTNTMNPNRAQLTDPINPSRKGLPTAGGLSNITATYTLSGNTAQDSFSVPTFGMSCYYTALEADWGMPPKKCTSVTIGGTRYSGTITDPYGYPGTYCSSFIAMAKLQGNGVLNSGQKIQYINSKLVNVDVINGRDGTPVVAGQTVARDRDVQGIIPSTGVYVTVNKINNNNPLLANDTGGAIVGYRLDLYNGEGKSACSGFNNVISVGACNPAQPACPSLDIN